MNEDQCDKKIFLAKPMGNRPRDRPLSRWIDRVEKDFKFLKVKDWRRLPKVGMPGEGQGSPTAVEPLKKPPYMAGLQWHEFSNS
ncbi:hypothetical protein TNCV_2306831 [Trichonephila clavipes]|nr:hypothetical protein TNCV_2306831 [Trichonephila clavipes]